MQAAYPIELAKRATSIETELGRPIARGSVVIELLAHVKSVVAQLDDGQRAAIKQEWRQFGRAGLWGSAVRWRDGDTERHGFVRDIDVDGALLVESSGTISASSLGK